MRPSSTSVRRCQSSSREGPSVRFHQRLANATTDGTLSVAIGRVGKVGTAVPLTGHAGAVLGLSVTPCPARRDPKFLRQVTIPNPNDCDWLRKGARAVVEPTVAWCAAELPSSFR